MLIDRLTGLRFTRAHRDIIKHSGVYGFGQILSSLASFVLLPLYTHYLTPRDYGVVAILDLTTALLAHLGAAGLYAAVLRHSLHKDYSNQRHALWTTGLILLGSLAAPQLVVAWCLLEPLSRALFTDSVAAGSTYLALALVAIPAQLIFRYCLAYLRAEKRSRLFVSVSIGSLLVRVLINVYLIVFAGLGVLGLLYSAVLASYLEAVVLMALLFLGRPFRFLKRAVRPLLAYGAPLMVSALAALAMHQTDRYLLTWLVGDLTRVGIYAVSYKVVQGVNTLLLRPFGLVWETVMYEVDSRPDRRLVFRSVFQLFVLVFGLAFLGVTIGSGPLVRLITGPSFHEAARVVPLLCLAFFLFSLHAIFRTPAMVHRRTVRVAAVAGSAAVLNVLANYFLIPKWGIYGAALASVVTYGAFSLGGQLSYRKIEDLGFRFTGVYRMLGMGFVAALLFQGAKADSWSVYRQVGWGGAYWLVTAVFLGWWTLRDVRRVGEERRVGEASRGSGL